MTVHWRHQLVRRTPQAKWAVLGIWGVVIAGAMFGRWRFPGLLVGLLVASILALVVLHVWARWQRDRFIREQPLPAFLKRKLREAHPQLSGKDVDLVERGLRQFFLACHRSPGQFVAMPSRVVDTLWHEFILHTQAYSRWCALTLGRFLHHTPAEVLGAKANHNDGLRRAWFWACKDEAIDPRKPTRLPLLFALDAKLAIANGFHYVPDCKGPQAAGMNDVHCATSFGDGSSSGDGGHFGGAESSSSDSDGGGGGDGSSCGGGCGGGGGD